MRGEQLELDFVSPALGLPGVEGLTVKAIRLQEEADTVIRDARLLTRLQYTELVYSELSESELNELRFLVGPRRWAKTHKLWERRARSNPRKVRKVLLAARSFLNL